MKITIPGEPIPKARARIFKNKYTGREQGFDPQTSQKTEVKWRIKEAALKCEIRPFDGPVSIEFRFFFRPPPKPKKDYDAKIQGKIAHTIKPDASNCIKFYEDCGNGILYNDDSQIIELSAKKYYSDHPRTEITILAIDSFPGSQ